MTTVAPAQTLQQPTAQTGDVPAQDAFQSRPFAEQPLQPEHTAPDIHPQLTTAQPAGHHFGNIPVFPPTPSVTHDALDDHAAEAMEDATPADHDTGLPAPLKAGVEAMSGFSMNDVTVHYNSRKPAQIGALAYAQGTDIHVGPGQEEHLPEEAWHTVQQKQGRVQPTLQLHDAQINDNSAMEHEAKVMGARAMQMRHADPVTTAHQTVMSKGANNVIQMHLDYDSKQLLNEGGAYNNDGGYEYIGALLDEYHDQNNDGEELEILQELDEAIQVWDEEEAKKNSPNTQRQRAIANLHLAVVTELYSQNLEAYNQQAWSDIVEESNMITSKGKTRYTDLSDVSPYPKGPVNKEGTQDKIDSLKGQETKFSDEDRTTLDDIGRRLTEDTPFYRWGKYEYEKRYVNDNGFHIGAVNFDIGQYGKGLYVADSPWSSMQYAKAVDGAIIKVVVPRDTLIVDDQKARDHGIEVTDSLRYPPMIDVGTGWFVIKDDRLNLDISFYQPDEKELKEISKHYQRNKKDATDYMALSIIETQMQGGLHLPDEKTLKSFLDDASDLPIKQARLMHYVELMNRDEYVPFSFSDSDSINFTDVIDRFFNDLGNSSAYKKAFPTILRKSLKQWAQEPFNYSYAKFDKQILTPFTLALSVYDTHKKKTNDNKKKTNDNKKVGKLEKLTTLLHRLYGFGWFLNEVERAMYKDEVSFDKALELHDQMFERKKKQLKIAFADAMDDEETKDDEQTKPKTSWYSSFFSKKTKK